MRSNQHTRATHFRVKQAIYTAAGQLVERYRSINAAKRASRELQQQPGVRLLLADKPPAPYSAAPALLSRQAE